MTIEIIQIKLNQFVSKFTFQTIKSHIKIIIESFDEFKVKFLVQTEKFQQTMFFYRGQISNT